jgi:hypothetical protein
LCWLKNKRREVSSIGGYGVSPTVTSNAQSALKCNRLVRVFAESCYRASVAWMMAARRAATFSAKVWGFA